MKKILCFGDSNVFGFNPINGLRFAKNIRFGGILSEYFLDKHIEIFENGMNNRTCFSLNQDENLVGKFVLNKMNLIDYTDIILCLGINDLQFQYNNSLEDFKNGLDEFVDLIMKKKNDINILFLIPNEINNNILNTFFKNLFNESSIEKSKSIAEIYKTISEKYNCKYVELSKIAQISNIDSLHYDEENHKKIAKYLIDYYLK